MPERDRDQSVERLLRRVMSDDVTRLQETCVDGETLAAWSEGSLRAAEASAVEHHVADCARCRALMASFVRTTPPEPVAESLWRRWHLAWAVPLATAATAAAIWVALPDNGAAPLTPSQETNTLARDERSASPSSAPAAESVPAPAPPPASVSAIRPQEEKAKLAESTSNEARQRSDRSASREFTDLQARANAPPVPQAEVSAPAPAAPPARLRLQLLLPLRPSGRRPTVRKRSPPIQVLRSWLRHVERSPLIKSLRPMARLGGESSAVSRLNVRRMPVPTGHRQPSLPPMRSTQLQLRRQQSVGSSVPAARSMSQQTGRASSDCRSRKSSI